MTSVSVGSPVVLRCSLSSAGNPPVTWSWFCNDVMVNKGVNQMGKSTELSFLAEQDDNKKDATVERRTLYLLPDDTTRSHLIVTYE